VTTANLKNGRHVGTRTPDLYRVKVAVRQPVIDSKGVNNRRNRENRNTRRNLLPNCYQNMASGFGAESWGIGPFTVTEFTEESCCSELNSATCCCGSF
jgi:hypothetical protein